jgi:hypothetical protein
MVVIVVPITLQNSNDIKMTHVLSLNGVLEDKKK